SSYWNAFECLVDAVCILRPPPQLPKHEKLKRVEAFVAAQAGVAWSFDQVKQLHRIVEPGVRSRAEHALHTCFGKDDGDQYIAECFTQKPSNERLYHIRNLINHGSIDAEHPMELARIEGRSTRLWMIVMRMFGCLVPPFGQPVDSQLAN